MELLFAFFSWCLTKNMHVFAAIVAVVVVLVIMAKALIRIDKCYAVGFVALGGRIDVMVEREESNGEAIGKTEKKLAGLELRIDTAEKDIIRIQTQIKKK